MIPEALKPYLAIRAVLFPIPAGQKTPSGIIASWKHDASSDPAQIEHWATENPGCNWGMVCAASGLIVVDIDIKNVGRDEAWHAWCDVCTSWSLSEPIKPTVQTQSGGWHIYLRIPADTRPDELHQPPLRSGVIDVRANGFVLIPPSQIDGKVYANF